MICFHIFSMSEVLEAASSYLLNICSLGANYKQLLKRENDEQNSNIFFIGFSLHKPRRVWSDTSWFSLINLGNKACFKKSDIEVFFRILKENHHIASFFGMVLSQVSQPSGIWPNPPRFMEQKPCKKRCWKTGFRFVSSFFQYLRF